MNDGMSTCPSWCTYGEHTLDPHQRILAGLELPGLDIEVKVRQRVRVQRVRAQAPPEVAVTFDSAHDGMISGRHTLAMPLPAGTDIEAFIADSDCEAVPGVTCRPGLTIEPHPLPAGSAVTQARQVLARARAAVADESHPYNGGVWAARLEVVVEQLLELVEGARS